MPVRKATPKKIDIPQLGTPSRFAILCHNFEAHDSELTRVFLTEQNYDQQMARPNARWRCPACGESPVDWDDDNFESSYEMNRSDE